jgi:hypothetical protein
LLLSFVGGDFGEAYVPSKLIMSGGATATNSLGIRVGIPLVHVKLHVYKHLQLPVGWRELVTSHEFECFFSQGLW